VQTGRQRQRKSGQRCSGDHVNNIVIPEVDRGDDQSGYQGGQHRKEYVFPLFPGVIEAYERNGGMPAREGVGLVFFEGIECVLNHSYEVGNLQVPGLEMAERKAGPDCRKEQVADIRKIEAEQDAEQDLLEFIEFSPGYQDNSKRDRNEIITDVGELEQACEQRADPLFQPDSRVNAKYRVIKGYQAGIAGGRMKTGDERSKAVENDEHSNHRGQD